MRSTWSPGTRANPRRWPKGAARPPSQAGGSAGPRHPGEGEATRPRPDPTRRTGGAAHAGQCTADDDPADHRGCCGQGHLRSYRRVQRLCPPAGLGLSAQDGLPRTWRVRARRGWRRLLRDPRQHDGGDVVLAALLAPSAPGHLTREAAALPRLLRVRAQRPAPWQSPSRSPRRSPGEIGWPTPRIPVRAAADYRALLTRLPPSTALVAISPLPVDETAAGVRRSPHLRNATLRSLNAA